jgi:hypothetical protein
LAVIASEAKQSRASAHHDGVKSASFDVMAGLVPRLSGSANRLYSDGNRTLFSRHGRACHGYPRVETAQEHPWMRGTSPRKTIWGCMSIAADS